MPTNIEALAIYLAVGVLGLLTWIIKRIFSDQKLLYKGLVNHMKEDQGTLNQISAHMASSNEILRALRDRLFDSALRKPEE